MKNIVIIPVRSGSKRLKGKNRLKLLGKSLVDWTVNFASKLNFIDDIIVSTDDELIIKENKNHKFVKLLRRPKYLAKDKTKTVDVILHVLKKYEKNFGKVRTVVLLQATSPFRSIQKLNLAYKKYLKYKTLKSVISVSQYSQKKINRHSFDIKKNLYANGNFYIVSKSFLRKNRSFFSTKNTVPIILTSKPFKIDINTKKDLVDIKSLMLKNKDLTFNYA
jgi:CMP-N-acetylneuraminic acid synthetase